MLLSVIVSVLRCLCRENEDVNRLRRGLSLAFCFDSYDLDAAVTPAGMLCMVGGSGMLCRSHLLSRFCLPQGWWDGSFDSARAPPPACLPGCLQGTSVHRADVSLEGAPQVRGMTQRHWSADWKAAWHTHLFCDDSSVLTATSPLLPRVDSPPPAHLSHTGAHSPPCCRSRCWRLFRSFWLQNGCGCGKICRTARQAVTAAAAAP